MHATSDTRKRPLRLADYSVTDEQAALRDAFNSFFRKECASERVRAAEPHGFDEELWRQLAELRAIAMGVPEEAGGDGAGLVELALLTEQAGLHLAPVPLVENVVGARLLARSGTSPGLLEAVVAGERRLSVALLPARHGIPQLVPGAAAADAVIGLVDGGLILSVPHEPLTAVRNQGYAPLAWWTPGAASSEELVIVRALEASALFAAARHEWQLLMAAALVGMAEGANRIAVEHAKSRIAFGVPIGTYQAVSHRLVDVADAIVGGRRLVHKAAWFMDNEPGVAPHLVPMAYLHAERTAMGAATVGVHTLGGVGFTVESDLHLYFRRVKGWTLVAGDPEDELRHIADLLYGVPAPS